MSDFGENQEKMQTDAKKSTLCAPHLPCEPFVEWPELIASSIPNCGQRNAKREKRGNKLNIVDIAEKLRKVAEIAENCGSVENLRTSIPPLVKGFGRHEPVWCAYRKVGVSKEMGEPSYFARRCYRQGAECLLCVTGRGLFVTGKQSWRNHCPKKSLFFAFPCTDSRTRDVDQCKKSKVHRYGKVDGSGKRGESYWCFQSVGTTEQ